MDESQTDSKCAQRGWCHLIYGGYKFYPELKQASYDNCFHGIRKKIKRVLMGHHIIKYMGFQKGLMFRDD